MPYISTGKIIEEQLKNNIDWFENKYCEKEYKEGKLVPDSIIIKNIIKEINKFDNNCILEGFPRTLEQCSSFIEKYKDKYILIDISQDINFLIERASNYRYCPNCNRLYIIGSRYMKPNLNNTCIDCNVEIIRREQDEPAVIINKINEYSNFYIPVISNLLKHTKKGINILLDQHTDIDLIINILSYYIIISDKYNFKASLQFLND